MGIHFVGTSGLHRPWGSRWDLAGPIWNLASPVSGVEVADFGISYPMSPTPYLALQTSSKGLFPMALDPRSAQGAVARLTRPAPSQDPHSTYL